MAVRERIEVDEVFAVYRQMVIKQGQSIGRGELRRLQFAKEAK